MTSQLISLYLILSIGFAKQGQVYLKNSTFPWGGQTITSFLYDQQAGRYHNVTDNGYGNINVKTWTTYGGFPGAITQRINTNSYELLGNNCYQFLLNVSFSLKYTGWEMNSGQLISTMVNYRDSQGDKRLYIVYSIGWIMWDVGSLETTGNNSNNQSIIRFTLAGDEKHNLWMYPTGNPQRRQNYASEFDVIGLIRSAKARFNEAADPFVLTNINTRAESNRLAANIDFNLSKTIKISKCCQLTTLYLGNFSVSSQIYQNISFPNYCKIFQTQMAQNLVNFGFNFQNMEFGLKSYQFVSFGYLNKKWVTPIGAFSLPLSLASNAQINVDFKFSYAQMASPTSTSVCFLTIIRNDYNQTSKNFNLQKTDLTAQIFICPWYKTAPPNAKRGKIVRLLGDQFYTTYVSQASWPIYTFIPIFQTQKSVKKFPLFDFVDKVIKQNPSLSTHFISGIQVGCRVYEGKGQFSIKTLNIQTNILPPRGSQPIVSAECIISQSYQSDGNKTAPHACQTGALILTTAIAIMSTPNSVLLLRMACTLQLIDDLTYYAYHNNIYDRRFRDLSLLAWNLTSQKWMIPQLNPIYEKFNFTYKPNLTPDPTFLVPNSYVELSEDANLLRQTEDFWISSLPFTIITFIIIYFLHALLSKFEVTKKIAVFIKRFSWFGSLFTSILGNNLQYLSFRCFSQLYQPLPLGLNQTITIITAHVTLFLVIFFASSSYLILPCFFPINSTMLLEGYRRFYKTGFYLIILNLLKVLSGYIHSALYKDNISQILYLLIIQIFIFLLLLKNHSIFLLKSVFTCNLIQSIFRLLLHLVLCLQQYRSELLKRNPQIFEKTTGTLIEVLFILSFIDIILTNTMSEQVTKKKEIKSKQLILKESQREEKIRDTEVMEEEKKEMSLGITKGKVDPPETPLFNKIIKKPVIIKCSKTVKTFRNLKMKQSNTSNHLKKPSQVTAPSLQLNNLNVV